MTENTPNNATNNENKKTVRQVRRPVQKVASKKVKKGTSVGGKGLLIGIVVFIFIVVLLTFGFFFYMTSHPNSAKALGMGPGVIKSITYIIAGVLFGSLFILFLVLGLSYLYKLSTKKVDKTKNLIGTIVIFILGTVNLILGWLVFAKIAAIKVEQTLQTNDILVANINYLNPDTLKEIYIPYYEVKRKQIPILAPAKVSFLLNTKRYFIEKNRLIRKEGKIEEQKFVLDCGNGGQTISYTNLKFPQTDYCLYTKRKKYTVKFKLIYNTSRERNKEYIFNTKDIDIDTDITFKTKIKLNRDKNRIILGERGDEIQVDLNNVPLDLELSSNWLNVSFMGDGNFEKYKGIAKYVYHKDGSFNIIIKVNDDTKNYPAFYFPVSVLPPTKPVCSVSYTSNNGLYVFKIKGEEAQAPIKKYQYVLKDLMEDDTVKKGRGRILKYRLRNGHKYQLEALVMDTSRKKGTCKSQVIDLTNKVFYSFDVYVNGEKKDLDKSSNIVVNKLPSTYKIEIKNIVPNKDGIRVGFDIDGDEEIDEETNVYIFKMKNKDPKEIAAIVEDDNGNKTVKKMKFTVDLTPVIAYLKVNKEIGDAPFSVKFDASTSEVTDDTDEIVFFNWDFGDGQRNYKTRQGIIEHEYRKIGKYIAQVEVVTKKGYKSVAKKEIFVRKAIKDVNILFPNNLGGQAGLGSPVTIQLNTNGSIGEIKWNFGDGSLFSCEGRRCTSISHTYHKVGKFKVTAKVSYTDGSPTVTRSSYIYIIDDNQ